MGMEMPEIRETLIMESAGARPRRTICYCEDIRREARGIDAHAVLAEFDQLLKTGKEPVKNPLGALTQFVRSKRKEWGGTLSDDPAD